MTPRRARALGVALLVALGIALSAPYFPERFSDFRAFYCAGRAVVAHADPYREHPLADCERAVRAPALSVLRGGVALPAPFPGCVLAAFAAFAVLPFGAALALWLAASCAALVVAVALIARVTRAPPAAAAIVIAFPALTVALPLGQVTPFVLLALAAAAYFVCVDRPHAAALASLGAVLDPHAGIALLLGVFVAAPRARLTLLGGVAGLVALGLAVSGPSHEWEYVRAVLPAHALANLTDSSQFSTSAFAYAAGMPAGAALWLGSAWYTAALAAGVVAGRRLRARLGAVAPVVCVPAFAVFGGTHTHLAQLALAVPAFLMLVSAARSAAERERLTAITFVAAIPWLLLAPFPLLFPAAAVLAVAFARELGVRRLAPALAAGTFAALAAIFIAILRSHVAHAPVDAGVDGNPLAETAWQLFVTARNVPTESWYLFAKGPTVIAFGALFAVMLGTSRVNGAPVRQC